MPLGKKNCPNCDTTMKAIVKICSQCNFDFSAARKIKKEEEATKKEEKERAKIAKDFEGEKISPEVEKLMQEAEPYEAPKKLTPTEQAERILSYGKDRATLLLRLAKTNHYWSHVNWNKVEEDIGALPNEDTSLIAKDNFDEYGDESDEIFCF